MPEGLVRRAVPLALVVAMLAAGAIGAVRLRDREELVRISSLPALPAASQGASTDSREMKSPLYPPSALPPNLDDVELATTAKAYRLTHDSGREQLTELAKVLKLSCPETVTHTETDLAITDCDRDAIVLRVTMTKSLPHYWNFSRLAPLEDGLEPGGPEVCRKNPACAPDQACTQECFVPPSERQELYEPGSVGSGSVGGGSVVLDDPVNPAQDPSVPLDGKTEDQLRASLAKLANASEVQIGPVEMYGSRSWGNASASLQLGGTEVPETINANVEDGEISYASGVLLDAASLGEYPLVNKAQLLDRIKANSAKLPSPNTELSKDAENPIEQSGEPAKPSFAPEPPLTPAPDTGVNVVLIARGDLLLPVFRLMPSGTIVDAVIDELLKPSDRDQGNPEPIPAPGDPVLPAPVEPGLRPPPHPDGESYLSDETEIGSSIP